MVNNGAMERREYEEIVARIIRRYDRDAVAAYAAEHQLIERFIRDRGFEGDIRAMALVRLLDTDRPQARITAF